MLCRERSACKGDSVINSCKFSSNAKGCGLSSYIFGTSVHMEETFYKCSKLKKKKKKRLLTEFAETSCSHLILHSSSDLMAFLVGSHVCVLPHPWKEIALSKCLIFKKSGLLLMSPKKVFIWVFFW